MTWRQQLQFWPTVLILKFLSAFLPMKIHGRLVNYLVGFLPDGELHGVMEDYLHILVTRSYDKKRGAHFSCAEEEVDCYLRFVPHVQSYRSVLLNICRNNRQAAGLKEKITEYSGLRDRFNP